MDDVPRPVAEQSVIDRLRDWVAWFGLARLVTSALAMVTVCAGAWFLMRSPEPPSESSLPRAVVGSVTGPTLPQPDPGPLQADATSLGSSVIIVHVAGAVVSPGVYDIIEGSRIETAIAAAGGPTDGAEIDALNLAAVVVDGSRIYLPEVGEAVPAAVGASEDTGGTPPGPVDVNRASSAQLQTLPGIGPATATAIIAERERNGPFVTAEDLERVPGIGPAKLAGLVDSVTT